VKNYNNKIHEHAKIHKNHNEVESGKIFLQVL